MDYKFTVAAGPEMFMQGEKISSCRERKLVLDLLMVEVGSP